MLASQDSLPDLVHDVSETNLRVTRARVNGHLLGLTVRSGRQSALWSRSRYVELTAGLDLVQTSNLVAGQADFPLEGLGEPQGERVRGGFRFRTRSPSRRPGPKHLPELGLAESQLVGENRLEPTRAHRLRTRPRCVGPEDFAVSEGLLEEVVSGGAVLVPVVVPEELAKLVPGRRSHRAAAVARSGSDSSTPSIRRCSSSPASANRRSAAAWAPRLVARNRAGSWKKRVA